MPEGFTLVDVRNVHFDCRHFGRVQGIGIPCRGPGLCDQTTKAIWAVFGLAPAAMFVTGAIMWWNRVLRPRWQALAHPVNSNALPTLDS